MSGAAFATSKRDAALFLRAAKEVAEVMFEPGEHKTCCTAIDEISERIGDLNERRSLQNRFASVFREDGKTSTDFWWGDPDGAGHGERRNQRVLALCFMAAMVEAGDA